MTPPPEAGSTPPPSLRSTGVAVVVSLVTLVPALAWLSARFPNLFFEDDAYFYLQIAWNLGRGAGSTFDGINVTNGYHLLWAALLVPFAAVIHALGLGKLAFA